MKKILTEAAAVGNATARAIVFRSQLKDAYFYPDSAWCTPFVGGSYEFLSQPGVRNLDARTFFFYYATGVTPAMARKLIGVGSQYAAAFVDADKKPLDGSKTYKLHLPPNIPAKDFWSIVVYDNQTRSMLQTDQRLPAVGSQKRGRCQSRYLGRRLFRSDGSGRSRSELGARPFPAKAGTSSFASTARSSRGTTRRGGQVRSS